MTTTEEITRVQAALKRMHSVEGYNKVIQKLKSKTTDPEVLSYMSNDKNLGYDVRLFAVAALGELQ